MTEVVTALLVKSFTSVIFTVFLQTVEVAAQSFGAGEFHNKRSASGHLAGSSSNVTVFKTTKFGKHFVKHAVSK